MAEFLHLAWILLLRPAIMLGAWVMAIVLVLSLLFIMLRTLYKSARRVTSMSFGKAEFNPYKALGVSPNATVHEIEAAYEREHKHLRPNEENWGKLKDKIKDIEKAYKTLKEEG